MMPFITVDYNEDTMDYRGVVLIFGEEIKRTNSRDFINDFNEVSDYAEERFKGRSIMLSSTVDHYIMDANLRIEWENK